MSRPVFVMLSLSVLVACADDTSSGGGGASGGAGGDASGAAPVTGGGGQGGTGGSGAAGGATGGAGGGACIDASAFVYGEGPDGAQDCLTFESANTFCGFGSDDAVCSFAVGCGISPDVGQCAINCEQGSSSFCNTPADVSCVVEAFCANDCAALMQCEFIL